MFEPKTVPSSFILLLILVALLLCVGRPASADYFKYTDKTGAVCITNSLDSVPPKYRAKMKVIREETLDKKDRAARARSERETPQPATGAAPQEVKPEPPQEPASLMARLTSGGAWKKPVLVVGVIVCLFLIVRKLSDYLPSAMLVRVIYLAFFLGTFVFLYKTYAEHVTNSYFTIKTKVITMFEKSNQREVPESPVQKLQESQ